MKKLVLRIADVIARFETGIMFTAYGFAFILGWELWISILACLGAVFGDDPNWYLQFSVIYWIKNVL
jgi:hypothetical protein